MSKVVLIITDSLGVGALPDAHLYGDKGADTFGHILEAFDKEEGRTLNIPNLRTLGMGNIEGVADGKIAVDSPMGCYGKMAELSTGKDTTTGHWEIAGIKTEVPFKTYPDGFPKEFMEAFEKEIGVECIGNYPASGTTIIEELGPEHEATGKPIVYTSADSVFQIAANIDIMPLERLYEICETARRLLVGDWACGRVIARPYVIRDGNRERTSDRRDYAVTPPEDTILDFVKDAGLEMYGVGKIGDIFNQKGLTTDVHTTSNMDGVDKTIEALQVYIDLLMNMPQARENFEVIKTNMRESLLSEKPGFRSRSVVIELWKRFGYTQDPAIDDLKRIEELTFDDVVKFYEENIKGKPIAIAIVGSPKDVKEKDLAQFGKVVKIQRSKLFTDDKLSF